MYNCAACKYHSNSFIGNMCDYPPPSLPAVFVLPVWCWASPGSEFRDNVQPALQPSPTPAAVFPDLRGMLKRPARGGPAVSCVFIAALIDLRDATHPLLSRDEPLVPSALHPSYASSLTLRINLPPHLIVPIWFWSHSIFWFLASVRGLALFSWMVTELTAPSPDPFLFQSSFLD